THAYTLRGPSTKECPKTTPGTRYPHRSVLDTALPVLNSVARQPMEALEHALTTAGRIHGNQLIHHSDRGSQYVSLKYSTALAESGIRPSVGTVGDSYDNALAETVNGLYKAELIHAQGPWTSVGEVELATLRWVHWWNTKRLHEALDYATPQEIETEYYLTEPINTGP
ncbi:integrase core domain-containing protein, partial [Corynebacterium striatum]|uniref:integrase core domain-containing protein n=1 Tax=Corynebacterium striatum TaxID=43770 RepID=UPI003B5AE219